MRKQNDPTSQILASQSKNESRYAYESDVLAPGGGSERIGVQQQTKDRNYSIDHWEAGPFKLPRRNNRYDVPQ